VGLPLTWPQYIDELASCHPAAVAVTAPDEDLSWQQLSRQSSFVGQRFAELGVKPGDIISIELPNCVAHVICAVAAWRVGATVLPLRWDLPEAERRRLHALALPTLVITPQESTRDNEISAAELMQGALGDEPPHLPRAVSEIAWLIASGGSTGAPKLIASSMATIIGLGGLPEAGSGRPSFVDAQDHRHPVHLVCSPLYHTQGFALLYHTLLDDFRNVLIPRFDAEVVLDIIEAERVTLMALVPTMLIRLLRSPTVRERDLSSLEVVLHGAGACPEWAIRRWIEIVGPERFVMGYGSSEGVCSTQIRGDEWLRHPGSVGRPLRTEVLVVDEEGQPVPAGEVGELYFRPVEGEHNVRYIGHVVPRTIPGGFLSIGDLGSVDEQGYLYIADRRTDMIVSGGANVYVSEVESVLLLHPEVDDAIVVGLKDPEWGRRVHGILQLRPEARTEGIIESVRAHCRDHLVAYKTPKTFEIVDDIGRSDSGKVNRRQLAEVREPLPLLSD